MAFQIGPDRLDPAALNRLLADDQAGALVTFEGWVRNRNEGKAVRSLEYEAYLELAGKEGDRILEEARVKFNVKAVECRHRTGHLALGDCAVWVGATAVHRDDAFRAARYVIDEIKHRLPIWKKEHYLEEEPRWVFCRDHHTHVHFHAEDYYRKQARLVSQAAFGRAKVLVVGAGGLGCPALPSLATAGVGLIGILDSDRIEISNVHRQPLFSPSVVGDLKAVVAQKKMLELNPFIKVEAFPERLHAGNAQTIVSSYDVVLDCTDNMDTKFVLQDACLKAGKPLVSASIYQHEGQLRTLLPGSAHGCLRCHQAETPDDSLLGNCNDFGVLGAWTAVLGSMQAAQALELIQTGTNSSAEHTLLVNLRDLSSLKVKNTAKDGCRYCAGDFELSVNDVEVSAAAIKEEGATFVDMREQDDGYLRRFVGKPGKVIVGCHRGVRSKRLVEAYRAEGHGNFYSLRGGASALAISGSEGQNP